MGWVNSGLEQKEFAPRIKKQIPINAAVECYPHTVEVRGSSPLSPTIPLHRNAVRTPPLIEQDGIDASDQQKLQFHHV